MANIKEKIKSLKVKAGKVVDHIYENRGFYGIQAGILLMGAVSYVVVSRDDQKRFERNEAAWDLLEEAAKLEHGPTAFPAKTRDGRIVDLWTTEDGTKEATDVE